MKIKMKKKSRSHIYDTNRPRLTTQIDLGLVKHKNILNINFFLSIMILIRMKQHIHEKVKLEKKNFVYKKACIQSVLIVEFGTAAKLLQ